MTSYRQAVLLRIFIGESDEFSGHPLHEAIVLKAREMGLAGATVLRGPMGFGRSSRLHTAKILRLSEDLPIVIEMVDSEEKIDLLIRATEEMLGSSLVTTERVTVIRYGHDVGLSDAWEIGSCEHTVPVDTTFPYYSKVGEGVDLPEIVMQQVEHFFTDEARSVVTEAINRHKATAR